MCSPPSASAGRTDPATLRTSRGGPCSDTLLVPRNVGNPLALADIPLRSQQDSLARWGVLSRPRPVSVSSVGCRRSLGVVRSHSACRVASEGSPRCRDSARVSGRLHDKPSAALRDSATRSSCTLSGRSPARRVPRLELAIGCTTSPPLRCGTPLRGVRAPSARGLDDLGVCRRHGVLPGTPHQRGRGVGVGVGAGSLTTPSGGLTSTTRLGVGAVRKARSWGRKPGAGRRFLGDLGWIVDGRPIGLGPRPSGGAA